MITLNWGVSPSVIESLADTEMSYGGTISQIKCWPFQEVRNKQGRKQGREEEQANTERERKRADEAEREIERLKKEIEKLKNN